MGKHGVSYAEQVKDYKKFAIKAARELLYPISVIEKLKKATNDNEIKHIMAAARRNTYEN